MAAQFCITCKLPKCTCQLDVFARQIVYRACRRSDLRSWGWSLLGYPVGLPGRSGDHLSATFDARGYHTHGMSSSPDPLVALLYATMNSAINMGIFAIVIDEHAANAGSVQRQAAALHPETPLSATALASVTAQNEIVLAGADYSAILGFFQVVKRESTVQLGNWEAISGDASLQTVASAFIQQAVINFRGRCDGTITIENCATEMTRLLGNN